MIAVSKGRTYNERKKKSHANNPDNKVGTNLKNQVETKTEGNHVLVRNPAINFYGKVHYNKTRATMIRRGELLIF